jgi:hypothetical protein
MFANPLFQMSIVTNAPTLPGNALLGNMARQSPVASARYAPLYGREFGKR